METAYIARIAVGVVLIGATAVKSGIEDREFGTYHLIAVVAGLMLILAGIWGCHE